LTLSQCPECGTTLPGDAPEGLCPQCLLKGVISSAHDAVKSAPEATGPYAGPATAPTVAELAPLFPQLEILDLIGQGGMGAVYKARQPSLDRLVAVKVLPRESGQDSAFAERFSREARALARLSHPNIVAIHDVGKAGDFYYLVMEYVDGINLRPWLRDGQLQPEQALRIVPQICDALQYAHDEGVVHRDIKPENILLDRKGRVKIADFGLAKLLGRDTGNFTLTGSQQVMGTPYYMAPEQVERPLEVDHRADIYSLGIVFYEMLTGQLPVGRFPMPSEKAGTDAFLDEVVLHAMEREPERRYQHASEVKTDIQRGAAEAQLTRPTTSFPRQPVPRARPVRHLVTTALAVLCCLTGLAACTLAPWIDLRAEGWTNSRDAEKVGWLHNPKQVTRKPGEGEYVAGRFQIDGVETGQGFTGAAICLLLCVFLIATNSVAPAAVWRHLAVVSAALALLGVSGPFLINRFGAGTGLLIRRFSEYPGGTVDVNMLQITSGSGPYLAAAAAVGLLALGAVQLYRTARPEVRHADGSSAGYFTSRATPE
jgi:hypothetical protein